ncbi:MAG TPA: CpaF family protein [Ktedonobacterales bacterium]|nr:CpaF family protein [Ktedonobacterales bacterium]
MDRYRGSDRPEDDRQRANGYPSQAGQHSQFGQSYGQSDPGVQRNGLAGRMGGSASSGPSGLAGRMGSTGANGQPLPRGPINGSTSRAREDLFYEITTLVQKALIDERDAKIDRSDDEKVRQTIEELLTHILEQRGYSLNRQERLALLDSITDEIVGLGPIQQLLRDDSVDEIMVNGPQDVYVERGGAIERTTVSFRDEDQIKWVINRIIYPIGRHIDEKRPFVDARLPDGSRVNAIIRPLALNGPTLTIRKFSKRAIEPADLVRLTTLSQQMLEFLQACVMARLNIIISGSTGSGKTTLLNALSRFIPQEQRIITIEDAAELHLLQPHVVRLESRPPNIEGEGEVTIRQLVVNSLRMRPDRIIVGECRSVEAYDMLQAMNTGHDGSLTTVHSNSPRDTLSRLESMVMTAQDGLPLQAVREQIARAIQLIVHQERMRDGVRRITSITEVVRYTDNNILIQEIFGFRYLGSEKGRVLGALRPTGLAPTFMDRFEEAGIHLSTRIFSDGADHAWGG